MNLSLKDLMQHIKPDIILGNTYHLYLRPNTQVLEAAGGLHRFMHWDKPILTDSGGYQVFSLANTRKIREEGVTFASHIDGSKHLFSPERVMEIERSIGGDIIMAFDECPPYPSDYAYAKKSMELTHRWAIRCKTHHQSLMPLYGYEQNLFPIVQGSTYADMRRQSAEFVAELDLPGNAIGGLSVGEPHEVMYEMTDLCTDILPKDKPRYLMGVGTPENILEGIALGVDMFDCVMPTRNARHGMLFTRQGIRNMKNAQYERDFSPIDAESDCTFDQYYTKAYLRHLFKAEEYLALQIASIHNLHFYLWLAREARKHILAGDFADWKRQILPVISQRI